MTMLAILLTLAVAGPVLQPVDDGCGTPDPGAIIVCKRTAPGAESRYRLPRSDRGFDPMGATESVSRERNALIDGDGAAPDLTRGSCSPVGASGATGCMIKTWRENDQRKGW